MPDSFSVAAASVRPSVALLSLFKPGFKFPVAAPKLVLQRLGVDNGVVRCVGLHQAGVHKDLAPVHQTGLDALENDPLEEVPEYFRSPALPRLGEDAVVRDLRVKVVTQEPDPVQPLRQGGHKFTLGSDIVRNQKEHQFQHYRGRRRDVAGLFGEQIVNCFMQDGNGQKEVGNSCLHKTRN